MLDHAVDITIPVVIARGNLSMSSLPFFQGLYFEEKVQRMDKNSSQRDFFFNHHMLCSTRSISHHITYTTTTNDITLPYHNTTYI